MYFKIFGKSLFFLLVMFSNISLALTIEDSAYIPKFTIKELLYPEVTSFNEGKLKVSEMHTLWFAQYGNPAGIPVIVLHGGPGLEWSQ